VEQPDAAPDEVPARKKTKKATSKAATSKSKSQGKSLEATDEIRTEDHNHETPASSTSAKTKSTNTLDSELYSAQRATSVFDAYAEPDDPSSIGAEGFERLCSDMNVSLEGALPLLLAWQMKASEMAKITRSEWDTATGELQISTLQVLSIALHDLEDLLLLDKPPLKIQPKAPTQAKKKSVIPVSADPYNRARYHRYAADPKKAFSELYSFCFALAKPPQARNIDMETASAFWSVLVVPRYPIMSDILEFINEKGTYKGVNKDLWGMTLEFCRTVDRDLSNYDADEAWPTMLDDFVAWKGSKTAGETATGDDAADA